jgi:hypothetical protein
LQKTVELKDLIRLSNEMLDDVNYRRKVAREIYTLMTEAVEIIHEEPAFFEVYAPIKPTLKVNLSSEID